MRNNCRDACLSLALHRLLLFRKSRFQYTVCIDATDVTVIRAIGRRMKNVKTIRWNQRYCSYLKIKHVKLISLSFRSNSVKAEKIYLAYLYEKIRLRSFYRSLVMLRNDRYRVLYTVHNNTGIEIIFSCPCLSEKNQFLIWTFMCDSVRIWTSSQILLNS